MLSLSCVLLAVFLGMILRADFGSETVHKEAFGQAIVCVVTLPAIGSAGLVALALRRAHQAYQQVMHAPLPLPKTAAADEVVSSDPSDGDAKGYDELTEVTAFESKASGWCGPIGGRALFDSTERFLPLRTFLSADETLRPVYLRMIAHQAVGHRRKARRRRKSGR